MLMRFDRARSCIAKSGNVLGIIMVIVVMLLVTVVVMVWTSEISREKRRFLCIQIDCKHYFEEKKNVE